MGRPSKLTPERRDQIVGAIRIGATREIAAQAAGIGPRTLYDWIARGRDDLENNHPDPKAHTTAQLRAIAAAQDIDLTDLGKRPRKASITERLILPTEYSQFLQDIERADAEMEIFALQEARRVGSDDWRFWITLLERRRPERYSRPAPGMADEITTPAGGVDPRKALEAGQARLKVIEGGAG